MDRRPFVFFALTGPDGRFNHFLKVILLSTLLFSIYLLTASSVQPTRAQTDSQSIAPPTGNTIALDPATRYQVIDGWEATDQAGQLEAVSFNNYRNNLLDQTINDLGINRVRLEVVSGLENPTDYFTQWRNGQITFSTYLTKRYEIVNDNTSATSINANGFKWAALDHSIDNIVLPMRQRVAARGETLWVNANYIDFGASTFEHKATPAEYAEFVLATYQHMQSKYGFVPDSWEVILEPDTSTANWSSAQVALAIKAAGDLLAANGFTPRFVAPSTTNAGNAPAYIDRIAQTSGAMAYVREFSYHRYSGGTDSILQSIASRAATYNKKTSMLEWIGANYQTLHQDIKMGRISSWQQYTMAFPSVPDNGAQYYLVDETNPNNPVLTMGSRTKFLRQYFKFIRAGAQRIEALTGNNNFDPLAFVNQNGKYVVVVKASTGGSFGIQGLPAGTYGIKYTTDSQYNVDLPNIAVNAGQTLSTSIPAAGVLTVYNVSGSTPSPTPTPSVTPSQTPTPTPNPTPSLTPTPTPTPNPTPSPNSGSGYLIGSSVNSPASTNLTAEGTTDWAHWGLNDASSFIHKSGVTQQISHYTMIGSGSSLQFTGNPSTFSWTGGTPTASGSNVANGVYVVGLNRGFQLSIPADTTQRTLKLYVGAWAAGGKLEASLSDGSAPVFVDTSVINFSGTSNAVYTLNYQAGSSGKILTVKWTLNTSYNSYGNITLQAATLVAAGSQPVNQAPVVNAGSDRSVTLPNNASLAGAVSDDGLPNPPAAVTVGWSKVSGPGTVAFGSPNQVNTSAGFSAAGVYVLRLTASDGALTDSDDVTVNVAAATSTNQAPTVNAGADQTATFPGGVNLSGSASDDRLPNPPASLSTTWSKLSGPGNVAFGNVGSPSTTATFSAAGTYVLRLTAFDGELTSTDDVNVTINTGTSTGGLISLSKTGSPTSVNLTAEGLIDWAHWGQTAVSSFNHKGGIAQQISNFTRVGSSSPMRCTSDRTYSWSNGTPTSAIGTNGCVYIMGISNGFQIKVPADQTQRTLKLFVGVWKAGGKLEVSLSDGSAPVVIDTSLTNSSDATNQVFFLNYRAGSSNQTMTVKWTINSSYNSWGNITLQAAALY